MNKCKKCGSSNCVGFYLLHPKEIYKIAELKEEELKKNKNATFKLIDSTDRDGNSDMMFTKFQELHIIIVE